ncbi:MAG: DNA-directed RNA polymerase subunit beta [Spirochaetes bacterium]|nr:DNA-directed RNA polymerase subunit beta [Spirochaetota bacterium]
MSGDSGFDNKQYPERGEAFAKAYTMSNGRVSFARLRDVVDTPDFLEMQTISYHDFLQKDVPPAKRADQGLQLVLNSVFPVTSQNEKMLIEFINYTVDDPKITEQEAIVRDKTFAYALKIKVRLIVKETMKIVEQDIFVGEIPAMTARGTFIVNGAERVVVSQIHRSPGVVFNFSTKDSAYVAKIIPDRGTWLEFELDTKKDVLFVRIDRKKKIPATVVLRGIGFESNEEILKMFYPVETLALKGLSDDEKKELLFGRRAAKKLIDPQNPEEVILSPGDAINTTIVERILPLGLENIDVLNLSDVKNNITIINTLEKDTTANQQEACVKVHSVIRMGEPVLVENAVKYFNDMLFNPKMYDLGEVGRYKINKRLRFEDDPQSRALRKVDIVETLKFIIKVFINEESIDDIDHLGNRRIRSVGELLSNQLKVGFARMERIARERMQMLDADSVTPQSLVSVKPVQAVIKEFFGTSQLSQFMDQTNPLSEITHKRRLNALGPGGLSRDRAGFEVRDVHHTHYGKICPIETPEGPNIGLIVSLATYAKVNHHGFLETPYRKVVNGKVSDKIEHLTAHDEERYHIAQANVPLKADNTFSEKFIATRYRNSFPYVSPEQIQYMDVAPQQIVSLSTALIPFLEHDDANRALMGSNMQRQGVPLVVPEAPIVGTGFEHKIGHGIGIVVKAQRAGKVIKVTHDEIVVKPQRQEGTKDVDTYTLIKYLRTNQDTNFHQRPCVDEGDTVKAGQVLADGPATDKGELALGRNVLAAFMIFDGYNFEDAILISKRLIQEDTFTSLHIEEFEIEARETKLDREVITRDIPNVPEEAFRNLDERGIVRIGAQVKPGDILVGKVTPKGETEITPEYRLLHSIFGEKARDVKDTSLRVPHGKGGTVIDIRMYSRENGDELKSGVEEAVKVFIAKKRKLQEGDKMAGRHGNKGVVARVMDIADMPYLADGTPVDIVLNPLGVPSRMNIGQMLELVLGWAGHKMGIKFETPVFDGAREEDIRKAVKEAGLPPSGRVELFDGRTGEPFKNKVTVGYMYMIKLNHLVEDKVHARSTGPYSLVTQQPLGGKAQFGGQRLGEMEVWALEAYGAANMLQEFLTVKSDDMAGRARIYEAIVKGDIVSAPGIPESFNVLVQELRGLGLDIGIFDDTGQKIATTEKENRQKTKKVTKIFK